VSSEDEGVPATVVLVPGKPADFTIAELAELAAAVSTETASGVSVGIAEQRASAPLADEMLHVILTLGEDYAFAKVLDATLGWACGKWRRRRRESEEAGESPQPIIVHFEGQVSLVFELDLPDGEPLTYDGPASPRGQRRSQPRWVVGPAALAAPERPDAAWIYPLAISAEETASLREELGRSSFEAEVADVTDPGPTITREDGGSPMETIARVMIASPLRELEATGAFGSWIQARSASDGKPHWTSASVIDTAGVLLRRLMIPPAASIAERRQPVRGIAPAVAAAISDLGLTESGAFEVDLRHATSSAAADSIQASGRLRCDGQGVAYLSTSTAIAEVLGATGTRVEVLLKLRVPNALLDVSRDWRPGENRVDFHFLCGEFAEHPVIVLESRAV
jgi:hypothetical protein